MKCLTALRTRNTEKIRNRRAGTFRVLPLRVQPKLFTLSLSFGQLAEGDKVSTSHAKKGTSECSVGGRTEKPTQHRAGSKVVCPRSEFELCRDRETMIAIETNPHTGCATPPTLLPQALSFTPHSACQGIEFDRLSEFRTPQDRSLARLFLPTSIPH